MRKSTKLTKAVAAAVVALSMATTAMAGEPRPWLCRDKPVFSDNHPMQYQVAAKGGGSWQIFFMQFQINGAHDGFSILDSRYLSRTPQTGTLPSGQYYAVALRNKGGAWICSYGEETSRAPGDIKNLCYGPEGDPSCPVTLSVKPQASAH